MTLIILLIIASGVFIIYKVTRPVITENLIKEPIIKIRTFSNVDFIAVDVETAQGPRWSICQIGLAVVAAGEIKETHCQLIRPPENKYSPMNITIHGITPERTKDKPEFPEVWEIIKPLITSNLLVAHNSAFDINCLIQTLEYYQLEIPDFQHHCTFKESGMSLADACQAYNVDLSNHHNAECDALACAKIYLKMKAGIEPSWSGVSASNQKRNKNANFSAHEKVTGDLLKPDLINSDPNNPFYSKKVVFTGILNNIERNEAARVVKSMGADIDTTISKRTNFVIIGDNPGYAKMDRIAQYNSEGCDIKAIYETKFLEMINSIPK